MEAHTTMAHSFHRCPYCSETFKFQTHLADHLKICSFYLDANPENKCNVCGEEFSLELLNQSDCLPVGPIRESLRQNIANNSDKFEKINASSHGQGS